MNQTVYCCVLRQFITITITRFVVTALTLLQIPRCVFNTC